MRRKYLVGPFLSTFTGWTLGGGTLPILPLYAMERGASESMSGLFLAFAFLCLAVGTMAAGLLPKDFHNRKWLIAASGLLMVGLTWLTGYTTTLMQLAGTIGLTWFLAGIVFSQAATLTGLSADPADRGTAFGILGMSSGFGSLVGGSGSDTLPILVFLLASQFLLAVTNGTGSLGRSIAMSGMGLSKSTITMTATIQGVVGIGFPPTLGWLSDKVGRRGILISIYLVTSMSLVLMAFSRAAWHFSVSVGLFPFLSFPLSVGPAYVVDIVPREGTAIGVSLFQSMFWAGSIVGMAVSGFAFDRLGTTVPILFSCLFPVAGNRPAPPDPEAAALRLSAGRRAVVIWTYCRPAGIFAPMGTHAKGTFEVTLVPQAAEGTGPDAALGRMTIEKTFSGDLSATSRGQMLTASTDVKGSAGYVAIERVTGTLMGRAGSFILQHNGVMTRGEPRLAITVVPDSGTGQLVGLAGSMAVIIAAAQHSYQFEYTLP